MPSCGLGPRQGHGAVVSALPRESFFRRSIVQFHWLSSASMAPYSAVCLAVCISACSQALPLEQGSLLAVCMEGALLHVPRLISGLFWLLRAEQLQAGFCGGPGEGGPRRHFRTSEGKPGQGTQHTDLASSGLPWWLPHSLPQLKELCSLDTKGFQGSGCQAMGWKPQSQNGIVLPLFLRSVWGFCRVGG